MRPVAPALQFSRYRPQEVDSVPRVATFSDVAERKLYNIRLAEEEKDVLVRAARLSDLPVATYIRRVALADARKLLMPVAVRKDEAP